jgi:NAD(P)-dependent dehydrogenase (short-subunit alcohol dehydrogenase family)
LDLSRYSLEGRVAIVTGGSGGIGSASARAFANAAIVSVPAESIPPVVADIEKRGVQAIGIADSPY